MISDSFFFCCCSLSLSLARRYYQIKPNYMFKLQERKKKFAWVLLVTVAGAWSETDKHCVECFALFLFRCIVCIAIAVASLPPPPPPLSHCQHAVNELSSLSVCIYILFVAIHFLLAHFILHFQTFFSNQSDNPWPYAILQTICNLLYSLSLCPSLPLSSVYSSFQINFYNFKMLFYSVSFRTTRTDESSD